MDNGWKKGNSTAPNAYNIQCSLTLHTGCHTQRPQHDVSLVQNILEQRPIGNLSRFRTFPWIIVATMRNVAMFLQQRFLETRHLKHVAEQVKVG
jgi:hypothetical protein